MKTATAIITARGGSKGIPRKNIIKIANKPLIAYTIEAALKCPNIDSCFVTTDDPEICRISLDWHAEIINRPAHLATDTSLSVDAVLHALETIKKARGLPDYFILLQPTSPLRNSRHIRESIELFFGEKAVSLASLTEVKQHPLKMLIRRDGKMVPIVSADFLEQPRQKLPEAYRINGAIYIMETQTFLEQKRFFVEPFLPYFMSQPESLDIDSLEDIYTFETFLRKK